MSIQLKDQFEGMELNWIQRLIVEAIRIRWLVIMVIVDHLPEPLSEKFAEVTGLNDALKDLLRRIRLHELEHGVEDSHENY